MKISARAPVRISFCGGGTDISAYYEEHGGVVLSAAIDKYSQVELTPRDDDIIEISSSDFTKKITGHVREFFPYDGKLDLLKAVINNHMPPKGHGFTMTTYQDVPSASGLGTSASMAVATLGALYAFNGLPTWQHRQRVAEEAYSLEMDTLKIVTGKQDQYAAAFGGLNIFEFPKTSEGNKVGVIPIKLSPEQRQAFLDHLLLVNIGGAHVSGDLQRALLANMQTRLPEAMKGLEGLKKLTYQMHEFLEQGRWREFGEGMHGAFLLKKMSNVKVSNSHIEAVYALARQHGALGGKISGAGGSGNLLLFCPPEKKTETLEVLESVGGENIPFQFDEGGLTVSYE